MPLPNEHSCRIKEPSNFKKDTFRRIHLAKGLDSIIGKLKGKTTTTTQSLRYKKKIWTAAKASKHCGKRGGRFEAASTNKTLDITADHAMLHYAYNKLLKKEDWYGWTKESVVKEHAKITDILRIQGKKMTKRSKLDESSWEFEKTAVELTPSDILVKLEDKKMNKEKIQKVGFTELFEIHKKIHKEKEVDKGLLESHSVIVDEYKRREMIHPYWSELDKVY